MQSEAIEVEGVCKATMVCRHKSGLFVPLSNALSEATIQKLKKEGYRTPDREVVKGNLVVNGGRAALALMLGGWWETADQSTPYINRITLGNGMKTGNLPNLADSGLVSEIKKNDDTIAGTFLIEGPHELTPEILFPPKVQKFPEVGGFGGSCSVSIDMNGETLLEDTGADFVNEVGVQLVDQVTFNNSVTNPVVLGIREVKSPTVLSLHNPTGFTAAPGLEYSIGTPGTQMLVSKLIEGNTFPMGEWGPAVLVHEAGLLLSNGTMFNRVVFAPHSESVGVLIQSDEYNGVEISVRFEWLVTF